jgi:cob(I)alamin adenosyltransferase
MANRLSKITTRTGDSGTTGLGDGSRIHKSAARVEALGDVDELNSTLGVLLTVDMRAEHRALLTNIQNALFDLGGELSIPTWRAITEAHLLVLDNAIAELNEALPPLKEFILPGGSVPSAHCHVCRTVARRAERRVATLMSANEDVSPLALQYLNRLSDLLFVLARVLNRDAGVTDVCWKREPSPTAGAVR